MYKRQRFASETGVDALAVSIGTTHGQYKSKAKINYELLEELKAKLGDTGLVPVSYTHLDVYKRQYFNRAKECYCETISEITGT